MSKSQRFAGLKNLAGGRENGAAHRLAESLRIMRSKAAELTQLREYLDSYQSSADSGESTIDTARWRNTRLFLSRLNDAVAMQESELAAATLRYQQEAERWRACHRQTTALQQLVDHYGLEELREAERSEQKELDEQVVRRKSD